MERQENYIYGGTINIDHKEAADILNLLIACEKLKLKELYKITLSNIIKFGSFKFIFNSTSKEGLLSICKNKNWRMKENELWDHIIRWGKAQNTELLKEINNWTTNDFNILKKP
ncbi:hypothetical protein C1646_750341 [Rhizophagus diaphanus]|nr:hypothetical protein C1646_750341 [Rhizophagus diaphanus] [Rhizophagus sp. MUCL 43196]